MIQLHNNGIDAIKKASGGAIKGLICTPYYTERGLALLDPFFDAAEEVEFWTRFNPLDWRDGMADMVALRRRIQSVLDRGKIFNFRVSDDLHAKIYAFSDRTVIIGSANLTLAAMTKNIEVICQLTEEDAARFLSFLSTLRDRLIFVAWDVFTAYVEAVADVISEPREGPVEEDDDMNAAIELAEETLTKSLIDTAPEAPRITHVELEQFIDYCRKENTDASRMVVARYDGLHNLQGHVKHCYFGAMRFFSEFPEFIAEIATTPGESLYQFTNQSVCNSWRDFLREHANEIDKEQGFRFRTLRVYLPHSLGGICSGGGGGSSTLKRVLPLVARMLQSL